MATSVARQARRGSETNTPAMARSGARSRAVERVSPQGRQTTTAQRARFDELGLSGNERRRMRFNTLTMTWDESDRLRSRGAAELALRSRRRKENANRYRA